MDIRSPSLLKLKGALFLFVGILAAALLGLLIHPLLTWQVVLLFLTSIWAFCRAYYFCFYVMEHYADPNFRYAGLLDLFLHLTGFKRKSD
jgi:hypothetical protein